MTPNPQTGLQYSDLARIVLERASTAREGVQLIGQMIAEYGYADHGGNSHLIADANEVWVIREISGGQKLWAAERLGDDDVRVLYPGYIENFPPASPTVQITWVLRTLFPSLSSKAGGSRTAGRLLICSTRTVSKARSTPLEMVDSSMSQTALENATRAMAPVTERYLIERVRDYRISDDEAGYGQVISLYKAMHPDLIRIWVAPTGSITAPFNPWWLGVSSVPPE